MPRGVYSRKRKPGRPATKAGRKFLCTGSSEYLIDEENLSSLDDGEIVYEVIGRYVVRTKASLEKTELLAEDR